MVGLKHPPEEAPTIPAIVARVMAMARVPRTPSVVEVVTGYLVCTMTDMKIAVNIICCRKTCHKGTSSELGFKMKGS